MVAAEPGPRPGAVGELTKCSAEPLGGADQRHIVALLDPELAGERGA